MGLAPTPGCLVALSLQCNLRDNRVVTIDRVDREVRVRSGAGSWPRESRSRVVKRGRIPLPWARSGYDLSEPGTRRNLKPGHNGSRAGTGDSIVLGRGHTWGPRMGGQPGTKQLHNLEGWKPMTSSPVARSAAKAEPTGPPTSRLRDLRKKVQSGAAGRNRATRWTACCGGSTNVPSCPETIRESPGLRSRAERLNGLQHRPERLRNLLSSA
jgi:hypothetical protein